MHVRHTLVDVCVEIEAAFRVCRGSRYIGLAQPGTRRQEAPGSDLRYSPCREKHAADVPYPSIPSFNKDLSHPSTCQAGLLARGTGKWTRQKHLLLEQILGDAYAMSLLKRAMRTTAGGRWAEV